VQVAVRADLEAAAVRFLHQFRMDLQNLMKQHCLPHPF
jgi:hypothetical protein